MDSLISEGMNTSMKTTKTIFGILSIVAGLAMTGRSQTYQFTIPISGYITMSAQDLTTGSSGVITNFFDTLSKHTVSGNPSRRVGRGDGHSGTYRRQNLV